MVSQLWFRQWHASKRKYIPQNMHMVSALICHDFGSLGCTPIFQNYGGTGAQSYDYPSSNGPLTRCLNCGLRMHRECRERFSCHRELAFPKCITARAWRTHVSWCMSGSLIGDFLWSQWRGKRSRYSRCMCNPQFYVSDKRPMKQIWRIWVNKSCRSTTNS